MNSLHIGDFCKNSCLGAAVTFVNLTMDVWGKFTSNVDLVGIISTKDNETVVKFHTKRSGQAYLAKNLETYDEAVLEVINTKIGTNYV